MKKTLALILTFIMVLALVPSVAFAADPVARIGETEYETLEAAVKDAKSGDTITLGEGKYTLYDVCGYGANKSTGYTAGKDLTFIGQGEKTIWQIGADTPKPNNGEYNSDYSFQNSESVTFKNMTLRTGNNGVDADYLGFSHTKITNVENCIMLGRTAYWGYTSATFKDTTFNCPNGSYALWYYTGTEMSFDNCTFNASGKVIHAYREGTVGTAENPLVLNFKDCKVVSSAVGKSVLNIKDDNNYYTVNISGTNTVKGLEPNNQTCSRLFQVEGWANNYNLSGGKGNSENCQAIVTIDGKTVWQDGRMVSHAIDTTYDKYTDGYKNNKFEIIKDTTTGGYVKKCIYCDYMEPFYGELSNEIELERTVMQSQKVEIETANPKDTYKVNGSSGITVDYTATMDMTKLKWEKQGSLYDDEITPWQMLAMQPGWITEDTVVFLKFTFDKNIDLETFQTNYNKATTTEAKEKLLMLTSNMFKMTDVVFGHDNTMTITCKWKKDATTDNSTIILNGYGLPVTNDWNGSKQINIENSGCVGGMVHIKNPGTEEVEMAEIGPNVAVNQVSSATPSLDTIQIPIVGGCKTDEFTLYYGGGSSGDSSGGSSGGGYHYPTATPVPVIVIPPKTGDMTVWQSILHFLGIR